MLYLDHAATTPAKPETLKAAWPLLSDNFGNPSSVHEVGAKAKQALDWARQVCADHLGVHASEIVFTSGGTESNNLAIQGIALGAPRGRHIISARTEHSSVLAVLDFLERVHGFEIEYLPVDAEGRVSGRDLAAALRPDTTLVTLMAANNEVGTLQDIARLSGVTKAAGVPFHTDAVQAPGYLDLDVTGLGVQALSLSGHKFGAPKGSGLAYLSSSLQVEPLIHGGKQEGGFRSGTQNVAWAVALAVALQLLPSPSAQRAKVGAVTSAFIDGVLANFANAALTGPTAESGERHPAIASFTFEGINGETLLMELENAGVTCSSGSACSSGSTDPSHVLVALGLDPDVCRTAVRFSFGTDATTDDSTRAIAAIHRALGKTLGRLG